MALETRGSRGYYYRSERIGRRVVKQYVGAGPVAQHAAELALRALEARRREACEAQTERQRHQALETSVQEFCGTCQLWAQIALVAAGFYQHRRSEWRRRHGRRDRRD
jgi:hypothetical protein